MHKRTVKAACAFAAAVTALTGCAAGTGSPASPPAATPAAVQATTAATRPAGITGTLYYSAPLSNQVLARLSGDKLVGVVPNDRADLAVVSPDGRQVAYVKDTTLWVTDGTGKGGRKLGTDYNTFGFELVWSPTGDRLLAAKGDQTMTPTMGTVDVATGAFTPLAHNPGGQHYVWSADGRHLGYNTIGCRIGIADADGGNARLLPGVDSCDPFSISADGTRIAVDITRPGDNAGDVALNMIADAVIDTATGKELPVAVDGELRQIIFQRDGGMLVRTRIGDAYTLTLLDANGAVIGKLAEPVKFGVTDALVAYVAV